MDQQNVAPDPTELANIAASGVALELMIKVNRKWKKLATSGVEAIEHAALINSGAEYAIFFRDRHGSGFLYWTSRNGVFNSNLLEQVKHLNISSTE